MSEFAMDLSAAYDEFTTRQLRNGEAPDVFLAELRTLASLFGGISEKGLACAFLAGLPERVRHLLKAGLRMEDLSVSQVLARARAVLIDEGAVGIGGACLGTKQSRPGKNGAQGRCFVCGGLNHFARDCRSRRRNAESGENGSDQSSRARPRNRLREGKGPVIAPQQGNGRGERARAPAFLLLSCWPRRYPPFRCE
ncbi:hypothetical protein M514_09404 [Trichuris suis]|uniref:CCHC-type domain-containing protein n=1 Tax=Trichuris suis TaxID=68888 RepID=A0A085LXL1_9BILA|nr:hypothetical protein M513_09404 [Trichuris suis]KFD62061.1 hypothetical protein M514_09404 [Trichuris suis]